MVVSLFVDVVNWLECMNPCSKDVLILDLMDAVAKITRSIKSYGSIVNPNRMSVSGMEG